MLRETEHDRYVNNLQTRRSMNRIAVKQSHHTTMWAAVQVFSVESKKAATFTVEFTPQELGSFSHELQLRVNSNPFEQYRVALTGATVTLLDTT